MGQMHREDKVHVSKCPPSILRKKAPSSRAVNDKGKAERRVRFREPEEITIHEVCCCNFATAHERSSAPSLPILLLTLAGVLLIMVLALYCRHLNHNCKAMDGLLCQLATFLLQMRHVVLDSWTWLTTP
ncbi:nutritionally-regulated adipose and cardiac enriched protein homolog isoform X1 [Ambystoma mexicanum]|uniref:nutritionally-regulated adipose and cardiac enriched protein homolog isoform X1 n=1 Tax=Ambystoma mexicanum TaxID=8296 RepID=UPI0037E704B9